VAEIEALEARLRQSKTQIMALIGEIEARPGDIDCAANARRVLSRMFDEVKKNPTLAADDVRRRGTAGRRSARTG
jgi:hypothetical protein